MSAPAQAVPTAQAQPRYAITMGAVLMATEDKAAYEKHVKEQYRQYKPVAEHEIFLTQELADAMWRLKRARKWEAEASTIEQVEKVAKYIAHIERTYHRAYKELKAINAERDKATGIKYPFHGSHHDDPDWAPPVFPAKPKLQNELQSADMKFMLAEYHRQKR